MMNLKFVHKLYLGVGFFLIIFMIGNIIVNSLMLNNTLKKNFNRELENINETIYQVSYNTYVTNQDRINHDVDFADYFVRNKTTLNKELLISFEIENQITHEKKIKEVPLMEVENDLNLSGIISSNNELVDYITKQIGVTVTIFQLIDEGLLRVSTSVRKLDGKRAIGTYIPTDSPVYKTIMNGETYSGRAYVVNDWYITAYKPIYQNSEIVGVIYVGVKQSDLTELYRAVAEIKIADQYFPMIIDTEGNVVISNEFGEGGNYNLENVQEYSFFQETLKLITENKAYEGEIEYLWENQNNRVEKRILHYKYFPDMEWIIGTAMNLDAINKPLIEQIGVSVLLSIVLFILTFILIVLGAKKFTKQLHLLTDSVERYAAKEFDARSEIITTDEIGNLARLFNNMAEKLNLLHRDLEAKVEEKTSELLGKTEELQGQNEEIEQQNEEIRAINDEMVLMNQELGESESKVRRMIENLEDEFIFFSQNLDGKYEYISPSITKILGYTEEEVEYGVGKYLTNSPGNENIKEYSGKVRSGEKLPMFELELFDKNRNKKTLDLLEVPIFDNNNNVVMVEGILHDITARKEIERSEEESRILFDKISNSANDAIIVIDNNGKIIFWNRSAEKIFGYQASEVIAQDLHKLLRPEKYKEAQEEAFNTFIQSGKGNAIGKTVDVTALHKDGSEFPVELSLSAIKVKGHWNAVGIVRNITDRKRAEQVQGILNSISNAVMTSENLEELIVIIKDQLSSIIDTQNFYIALYDEKTDSLTLPFMVDENDKIESFPAGKTMTAYVIKTQKSLLASNEDQEKLQQKGHIEFVGTRSKVWIGVPLKLANKVIGVLAVQSYTNENAYNNDDKEVLEIISNQISLSIERKKTSDNLKVEKEYAERILQVIPSAVFTVDNNQIITSWNKMAEEVSGYSAEEAIGKNCELLSSIPCGGNCGLLNSSMQKPITKRECTLTTKTGETKDILKNVDYLKDVDGNIIGGIESFQDITERKRMEQVQKVISNISNAVALSDNIESFIVEIQKELSTIIDTTNFYIALYHKETDSFTLPFLADKKDDIESFPAGKTMTAYVVKSGKALIATDKEQDEMVEKGLIEFKGSRSKIWLGVPLISKDEAIGALAVQSYEDEKAYSKADVEILEIFSNQISLSIEKKKAADLIKLQNFELNEQKEELTVTLEDLKDTQSQLIQSEKMAALGQLIAGIAHEINTPLGAINASVGNMSDSLSITMSNMPDIINKLSDNDIASFLRILELSEIHIPELTSKEKRQYKRSLRSLLEEKGIAEADKMAETIVYMKLFDYMDEIIPILNSPNITLILTMSRNIISMRKNSQNITLAVSKASNVVFALKKFAHRDHLGEKVHADIIDGIETVLTLYHNQIKQGVEVIRKFEPLPMIPCYADDLNQVWTNLIHNSLQAMENKGTIIIETKKYGDKITVSISDTGGGIPEDVRDKIFLPFFTTKKAGEGSGLGLDIIKKIIDKHEGSIDFETEVGKGTTFIISLPFS